MHAAVRTCTSIFEKRREEKTLRSRSPLPGCGFPPLVPSVIAIQLSVLERAERSRKNAQDMLYVAPKIRRTSTTTGTGIARETETGTRDTFEVHVF